MSCNPKVLHVMVKHFTNENITNQWNVKWTVSAWTETLVPYAQALQRKLWHQICRLGICCCSNGCRCLLFKDVQMSHWGLALCREYGNVAWKCNSSPVLKAGGDVQRPHMDVSAVESRALKFFQLGNSASKSDYIIPVATSGAYGGQ